MRHLECDDSSEPVDERFVKDYETLIGTKLPDSYRQFLLATNGGILSSNNKIIEVTGNPEFAPESITGTMGFMVDNFYGLTGLSYPSLSLFQVFDITRDRIPLGTVPIAKDPFGNLFLLGVSGAFRDSIFFWDHEIEGFESPDGLFSNVGKLFNSFEAFIDALEPTGQ